MQETIVTSSGLFASLLGDAWPGLDAAVRRFHEPGADVAATGVFRVSHGGRLARLLAWLARMPAAGDAVAVQLRVVNRAGAEEWGRSFAGRPMVSVLSARPDGLLAERMGQTELRFRLAVADGALTYQSVSAAICLGPLRVPLPRWLAPRVTASERPVGERGQIDVAVEVVLPVLGRMIAYAGRLALAEGTA